MLSNQHFVKAMIVFIAVAFIGVAGLAMPTGADEHQLDMFEDLDELEDNEDLPPTIRYSTIVGLHGQSLADAESENFVIELQNDGLQEEYPSARINQMTLEGFVVPDSGIQGEEFEIGEDTPAGVVVNTGVYDRFIMPDGEGPYLDPQGDYTVRQSLEGAGLDVVDQHPEAPEGVDVAITNVEENEGVLTLTAETTAQNVAEYTWTIELGPVESVEEDGDFAPNALNLLDGEEPGGTEGDIAYRGLDGVYDLDEIDPDNDEDIVYPGTLEIENSPAEFDLSDLTIRHVSGELDIAQDIAVPGQLDVDYEHVSDRASTTEDFEGPRSEGSTVDLTNDYLDFDSELKSNVQSLPEQPHFDDTSLNIDVETELAVFADYHHVDGSTESVTLDGEQDYTIEDGNVITFDEDSTIITETLSIEPDGEDDEFDDSDVTVVDLNADGNNEIVVGDDVNLEGDLNVVYDVPEDEEDVVEVEEEILVDFGDGVSVDDTENLAEDDVIVNVEDGSIVDDRFEYTVIDQGLTRADRTLAFDDDIVFGWGVDNIEGNLNEVEFNTDVEESLQEDLNSDDIDGNDLILDINPELSEFELGFEMTENHEIEVFYGYYQSIDPQNDEEVVGSGEFGPSGVYEVEDDRTDDYDMVLENAEPEEDIDVTVEDEDQFYVRVEEGDFSGFSSPDSLMLETYHYDLGEFDLDLSEDNNQVDVSEDRSSTTLEIEPDHSRDQVSHDFTIEASTEDTTKTDTVTVAEDPLPDGSGLGASGLDHVVINQMAIDTGTDYVVSLTQDPVDERTTLDDVDTLGHYQFTDGQDVENYRFELDENAPSVDEFDGEELHVTMWRPRGLVQNHDVENREFVPVRNEDVNDDSVSVGDMVQESFEVDSDNGQLDFDDQNRHSPLGLVESVDWELQPRFALGDRNDDDQRVYVNRLNNAEEPQGPVGIPIGSQLVVAGNEYEEGDNLILSPEDTEDRDVNWNTEIEVEASPTVNENQVVINTSVPSVDNPGELEDRFELVDPQTGDAVFNYATTDQSVTATVDPEFINLNADPTANLNITSQMSNYDVFISSEQLDAEELLEDPGIFSEDAQQEYDMEIRKPEDDDNEQIRLRGLSERPEVVEMVVEELDEDDYGLQIDVVNSEAQTNVQFQTAFGPEGSAEFISAVDRSPQQTFRTAEGDRARLGVSVEEADEVTMRFADGNYPLGDMEIELEDGREDFVLFMDTYRASGESADGSSMSFGDVFDLQGAEFTNAPQLPNVSGTFSPGFYPVEVEVDGRETDLATIVVRERETRDVSTWVMPRGTDASIENVQEEATEQSDVAVGDTLVIDIEATGLDTPELITNETDPAKLVNPHKRAEMDDDYDTPQDFVDTIEGVDTVQNASQVNVEVEGEKPANRPSPHMLLDQATEIESIVDQGPDNRFFVFLNMNDDAFDNFDTDNIDGVDQMDMFNSESIAHRDHLTDYELSLNFTSSYPYVDSDDNDADFSTDMSVNERRVWTQMPVTQVDEEDLDTRFSLQQDENASVRGDTYVAPGTEVSVVVRDDVSRTVVEDPRTLTVQTEVEDNSFDTARENTVSSDFDLSGIAEGRQMTIQFMGINQFRDPAIIEEPDVPPEIVDITAEAEGQGTFAGDEITFSAEIENVDPVALEYDWSFGDGEESSAPSPTHVYDDAGNYDIELTVTDPQTGLSDSDVLEDLVVTEIPRTAPEIEEVIAPEELEVDEAGEFAVVATDEQSDPDELIYEWDFGDGSTGTGISVTNAYSIADTYTVEVTVSDPEEPEDLQTTEDVLVEVTDTDDEDEDEADEFELEVFTQDIEAGSPLPNVALQITDSDTGDSADVGETGGDGTYTVMLDEGSYAVDASAAGYEGTIETVDLDEDTTLQIDMVPEVEDNGDDDDDDDPDQPGFTLLLAAIGLVAAGAYIYYRRRIQ